MGHIKCHKVRNLLIIDQHMIKIPINAGCWGKTHAAFRMVRLRSAFHRCVLDKFPINISKDQI